MTKILLSLETKESLEVFPYLGKYVDGVKINHLLWNELDFDVEEGKELFVDFKLWDTPNTMKTVVESIIKKGGTMTTISTLNNPEVFHALKEFSDDIKLLGVSFLTSWRHKRQSWEDHVELTEPNGFKGMICSAKDIPNIKSNLLKVCPGITYGNNNSGQIRTTTPKEAQDLGADYIVIGRAVTESQEPIQTLKEILETLCR